MFYYLSEPSIIPCSIKIPPPNFQKKSEILKISDNNCPTPKVWVTTCQFYTLVDRFAVPSSVIAFKIWKTITGTIMLSIKNQMQFNHLKSTCLAGVDLSLIIIVMLLLCEELNKQAFNLWKKSLDNLSPQDITLQSFHPIIILPPNSHFVPTQKLVGLYSAYYGI